MHFIKGPRYHSRGIDKEGFVSNFCETEQLLLTKDSLFSFLQIRGSMPIFWNQLPTGKYAPRIDVAPLEYSVYFTYSKHDPRNPLLLSILRKLLKNMAISSPLIWSILREQKAFLHPYMLPFLNNCSCPWGTKNIPTYILICTTKAQRTSIV